MNATRLSLDQSSPKAALILFKKTNTSWLASPWRGPNQKGKIRILIEYDSTWETVRYAVSHGDTYQQAR